MLRIPLMLEASPRFVRQGPMVPVNKGDWRVVGDFEDSRFQLICHSPEVLIDCYKGFEFRLEENSTIQVRILEAGSEGVIAVYLEEVEE